MIRLLALAFLAPMATLPARGAAQGTTGDLVLTHANVVDVSTGQTLMDATVIVRGRIIQTVAAGDVPLPAGVRVIDVQGMHVTPGLLDAHVHIGSEAQGRRALYSGVTTVRSMGTNHFADVGLRELAGAGHLETPDFLAAGYHVRPTPSEAFFQDHPEMAQYMGGNVQGEDAVRAMVHAVVSHGVDFVKTNATERAGLPNTDPRKQLFSEAELSAIVEEAAAAGVPVAAHAHGDEGGRAAVLAGVRSIEHGTYLSQETLALMASRGTFLVPTVAIMTDLVEPGGDYDVPYLQVRGRHMLRRLHDMVRNAHRLGVKIVAATDTGYGPDGVVRLAHEIEELAGLGLSNLEAIQAATINAAELFRMEDRVGRVSVGLEGDLVITQRNPLEDIRALQDVLLVVSNGNVAVARGDWFSERTRPISP